MSAHGWFPIGGQMTWQIGLPCLPYFVWHTASPLTHAVAHIVAARARASTATIPSLHALHGS